MVLFCIADPVERYAVQGWLSSVALRYERNNPIDKDAGYTEDGNEYTDEEAIGQAWVDATELGRDRDLWVEACDFFLHDRDNIDQIAQFPGPKELPNARCI